MERPSPKVLLFTDTLGDVNGVTRFIRSMAGCALEADRRLAVVASTRVPCPCGPNLHNVPPRLAMRMPGYADLELALPPMRTLLRRAAHERPDVIHVSTPGPVGLAGALAARRLKVSLVGTYHTDFPAYVEHLLGDHVMRRGCEWLMRSFYGRFDAVLVRSGASLAPLGALGLDARRLHVLPAGCDLDLFHPRHADRSIWRREGLDPETLKVLYCGRVSVEKNLPLLVAAWRLAAPRLAARGVRAELVVVGGGPYLERMHEELRGLPAHLLGFRHGERLSGLYASSDLFVFPSVTDTLGQVVLEAQASGLPAIVSDVGGPKETVRDGESGLITPAGDADRLAAAIVELLTDEPRRLAMGRRARELMSNRSTMSMFEHFWSVHERCWRARTGDKRREASAITG